MSSPTAKSLARLRKLGYCVDVVERWIAQAGVRRDLFHCIDIVAVKAGEPGVFAVQATALSCVSARVAKASAVPELATWLRANNRFEVWGWYLQGGVWEVKRVALRPEDLQPVVVEAKRRRSRSRHRQGDLFGDVGDAA